MQQFARFTRNVDGTVDILLCDTPQMFSPRPVNSRDFVVTAQQQIDAEDLSRAVTWPNDGGIVVDEDAPFILKSVLDPEGRIAWGRAMVGA